MAGTYLDRAAWYALALPRLGHVVPRSQFTRCILHHTVMAYSGNVSAYMRTLQTARPDLGRDVPYSFVVFPGPTPDDYIVCEGRGFDRTGAHTPGFNSSAYGVALAGDYTTTAPTPGMVAGVRWVGAQLIAGPLETLGHKDTGRATACPGDAAYPLLPQMQPPFITAPAPPDDEEDEDMAALYVEYAGKVYRRIGNVAAHLTPPAYNLDAYLATQAGEPLQVVRPGNANDASAWLGGCLDTATGKAVVL